MATVAIAPADLVQRTVAESFEKKQDGLWYPMTSGHALVRISIGDQSYSIERRRKPHSGWMQVVKADVSEFDPVAFRSWAGRWPLTVH